MYRETLLPALSKDEYDALEALAQGHFSSVGAVGYPMTTLMLPFEEPYCIPADQFINDGETVVYDAADEYHAGRFLQAEELHSH